MSRITFGIFLFALVAFATAEISVPTDLNSALLSDVEVKVGWKWTEKDVDPSKANFTVEYRTDDDEKETTTFTNETEVILGGLKKNTKYTWTVKVTVGKDSSKTVEGNFQTSAFDWETPQKFSHAPTTESEASVKYNFSWDSIDNNQSLLTFRLKICHPDCEIHETSETQIELGLDYYREYRASVSAVYGQPLDTNVTRSTGETSFTTKAGKPSPVRDLRVSQKEATNIFVLGWNKPERLNGKFAGYKVYVTNEKNESIWKTERVLTENVQIPITKVVDELIFTVIAKNQDGDVTNWSDSLGTTTNIFIPDAPANVTLVSRTDSSVTLNAFMMQTGKRYFLEVKEDGEISPIYQGPEFTISSMSPNQKKQLEIRVCYNFANSVLCGASLKSETTSNVGTPTVVENLRGKLVENKPSLTWEKPEKSNGPLDGYQVKIVESESSVEEKVPSNETKFEFKDSKNCKKYTISVQAYNLDLDTKQPVSGPVSSIVLKTEGDCSSSGGFPTWAIVLIVLLVLAAVGGAGAYYYMKKMR